MIIKRREFVANNIALREISSRCISKYKESQAFALNELQGNATHSFSKTAREILLLKYDTWFKWLIEVEDLVRRYDKHQTDIAIAAIIIKISDDLEKEYIGILNAYPSVFEAQFVKVWLQAHSFMYKYLRAKIMHFSTQDLRSFFINITDTLIRVMDNTLFELHEIDNLFLNPKEVFVSFDSICLDYRQVIQTGECLLVQRLGVYKKTFPETAQAVIIKDYSPNLGLRNDTLRKMTTEAFKDAGYLIKGIV